MPAETYSLNMRILHWLMAIVIIGMLGLGIYMHELPKEAPNKMFLYSTHKSFGVLMLLFIVIRIAVRLKSEIPALPTSLKNWEKKAAHFGHKLLYLLMVLVPCSGYIMSSAFEKSSGIIFFGLTLPDITPKNETLFEVAKEAHEIFAFTLLLVLFIHVAGVIKHRYFDKENDVLPRMLGGKKD